MGLQNKRPWVNRDALAEPWYEPEAFTNNGISLNIRAECYEENME